MSGAGSGIAGGGGQQSMAALELLANPERLKTKLESLKNAEESAREQIALAGPASEILQIREEIEDDREAAAVALDAATATADDIVDKASEESDRIIADASESALKIESDAAESVKKAEAIVSGIKSHEAVVQRQIEGANQRDGELDRREESLQQRAEALEVYAQELEGEKEKLAEIRGLISTVLE